LPDAPPIPCPPTQESQASEPTEQHAFLAALKTLLRPAHSPARPGRRAWPACPPGAGRRRAARSGPTRRNRICRAGSGSDRCRRRG